MTDTDNRKINWTQYWREREYDEGINTNPSVEVVVNPLLEFLGAMKTPDSYADVGCGNGDVVFTVAEQHPETTVIVYDAAEPVLEANRERARRTERPNVTFLGSCY